MDVEFRSTVPSPSDSTDEADFQLVGKAKKRRRRRRSRKSSDDGVVPAKQNVCSEARVLSSPRSRSPSRLRAGHSATPPRRPAAAATGPTDAGSRFSAPSPVVVDPELPKRAKLPPPVILHNKADWEKVTLSLRNLSFLHAKNMGDLGIKVQVQTSNDHRALTKLLRERNYPFHTYQLEEERELRVVIRGLPHEIHVDHIKADLSGQGYPIRAVHRMSSFRSKQPLNLVLVVLDYSPEAKQIFNVKEICMLSGLSVEAPNKRSYPGQCHRCQNWGHSARNCNG